MIKYLVINYLLSSLIIAQTTIKIYNNGHALVQEERKKKFLKIGRQDFKISDLPINANSSSINIISKDLSLISKKYYYKPISIKNLLNVNIGNEIELVSYDDDGKIKFSTTGILISNNSIPIFEIDGKIYLNPPYNYRFENIPDQFSDYPYLNCDITNFSEDVNYNLSYLTSGVSWSSEYNLFLNQKGKAEIEGWYYIQNNNNYNYKNSKLSLISGIINFNSSEKNSHRYQVTSPRNKSLSQSSPTPSFETEEYAVFTISDRLDLDAKSELRYKFISKDKVAYKTIYYISHSINQYRNNSMSVIDNVPVYIRYDFVAQDIDRKQLPEGIFNIYEKDNENITYIGSSSSKIVSQDDLIKLNSGQTNEILCQFNIKEHNVSKNTGRIILKTSFDNRKNQPISIEWIENIPDSKWKITDSSLKFIRLDAYRAIFQVQVQANSKKEIRIIVEK